MEAEPVRHQRNTDQQQKRQRQHFRRGVAAHEVRNRSGCDQHHSHGNHDSGDHHEQFLRHANGRDDGIDGKYHVNDDDLTDDRRERQRSLAGGFLRLRFAFDLLVDFRSRLVDEENATSDQNDVAPREPLAEQGEHIGLQPDDPGQREQQHDAEYQCQDDPDTPRPVRLFLRQALHDDGNEHDIVDTEHDLHDGQRGETGPDGRVGQHVDHHRTLPRTCRTKPMQ